jgi:4-hydroxyacetophenone monooxygenase
MIGAGASGFKIAPKVRWVRRHLPFYGRWFRFLRFWPGCDEGL